MSDLQIALIAIGALVVAGVYGFGWMQQRKYRREAERAFGAPQEDVLLTGAPMAPGRIEPKLNPAPASREAPAAGADHSGAADSGAAGEAAAASSLDREIDYVAEIRPASPVSGSGLAPLLQHKFDFGKPVRILGLRPAQARWEDMGTEPGSTYARIGLALQLADRAGPVSELQLAEFRDLVRDAAEQLGAESQCPEVEEAHARAVLLDGFCAEVDVMIGLNVVSRDGSPFAGTRIRAMAEAAGFKLAPDGSFKYLTDCGEPLYSMQNLESAPFSADAMRTLATRGITLLLDIPRVAEGGRAFDQMIAAARQFCASLDGSLVDDKRAPLNDAGLARIRSQIESIQARMAAQGIRPGEALALRLFS